MTATTTSVAAVRSAVAAARGRGDRVALVAVSTGVHAGHLALVARARELADLVVVSLLADERSGSDRAPEADAARLAAAGVDVVFAPAPTELLPDGRAQVRVLSGPVGAVLEGRSRPGHFDGVLTTLLKLLHVVGPDVLLLGQRDAQQVLLVQRMVRDLDVPVRVEVVDTVRDADGLAISHETGGLGPGGRRLALAVPAALEAAESSADLDVDAMIAAAQSALAGEDGADLEYLAVVDPATFRPVDDGYRGRALVLVAARVGGTRLIDNRFVHLG